MDRRRFLKNSAASLSGIAVAGMTGLLVRPARAQAMAPSFSLGVVTDQPERSIDAITRVLAHARLAPGPVRFEEYRMPGRHVGDMALFRDRHLVDFRRAADPLSRRLTEIAEALGFPRRLDHPAFLKFYAGNPNTQATQALVFQGDLLIDQVSLDQDRAAYPIDGTYGSLTLAIVNRNVKVVGASCTHKTCMNMGRIGAPGESLVCIPARLSVVLDGAHQRRVDSVTQ